jgi:hypothetical protein
MRIFPNAPLLEGGALDLPPLAAAEAASPSNGVPKGVFMRSGDLESELAQRYVYAS